MRPPWRPMRAMTFCAALVALTLTSGAQPPPPPPAPNPPSLADSLLVLVPIRSLDEIQHDLQETSMQKVQADLRAEQARLLQARATTAIKVKKSHLETLEAQRDLARKEKDARRARDLELELRQQELEKQLLERRETLRKREIDYATATGDYVDLQSRCYELELKLAGKREQRRAIANALATPATLTEAQKLEREILDLERKTLEAQIDAARKRQEVAKQEAEVAKARKRIYEAQVEVVRGG